MACEDSGFILKPSPPRLRFSAALGRLLPNLGGPDGRVRRIYMGTVNSVVLYGAPVRGAELAAARNAKDALRRVQRIVHIAQCPMRRARF